MEITIFYSWISQYNNANKRFVRKCIDKAVKRLQKDKLPELEGIDLIIAESLDKTPGHQVLTTTQDEEIRNSDIFIGDWTIINPYNFLEHFLAKAFRYKRTRSINTNVVHEYEIFVGNNGHEGAVLVMDASRGSAQKDNDLIPVDYRSRRFPIEFSGTTNIDELSQDIYRSLKISVPAAIKRRKNRFSPLHTWYEQEERKAFHEFPFYENERILTIKETIRHSDKDLRILGMSGIGKTRMVHEAFREEDDAFYRNNYLYAVFSDDESAGIRNSIEGYLTDPKNESIICVDNCPTSFARIIQKTKCDYSACNRIITIYNHQDQDNSDPVSDVETIAIGLDDVSSVVDSILDGAYSQLSDDKKKVIKDFSAGLPMMAVILAENAKSGRLDFTRIPNNELVDKLLDVDENHDQEILKSCALFSHIGYRDEVESEAKFIICNKHITPLLEGGDDARMTLFLRTFNKYTAREIFEIQGRFFAIRPIPLALKLAEDWLAECNPERLLNVITDIQIEDARKNSQLLTSAFASQMSNLAGNEKAQNLVKALTGIESPFANAEVLNTELGSRLFRSLVEVDPVSVADLIWRVFGENSTESLLLIKDGRRNLVWTIQKLCFDKRTFRIGTRLLIKFALAENETLGNNATNEAITLFHVYLPGTEADLDARMEIINWVRTLDGAEDLLIKILSSALMSGNYTYMCGAEKQGSKRLDHYMPSGAEIVKYWENISSIIKDCIVAYPNKLDDLSDVVSSNFGGLIRAGVSTLAFDLAEFVAEKRNWEWEKMRESLRMISWRNGWKEYPEPLKIRIEQFKDKLTKDDFISRFRDASLYERGSWDDELKKKTELYKGLAHDFIEKEGASDEILRQVLLDSSLKPYNVFGAELYNCVFNDNGLYQRISTTIISTISETKNYADSTLIGFWCYASKQDFEVVFPTILDQIPDALFPLLAIRCSALDECSLLFDLVSTGRASINSFDLFCSYCDWSKHEKDSIIAFFDRLARLSSDGSTIALERMKSLLYFDKQDKKWSFLVEEYRKLIIEEITPARIDHEEYMECVEMILDHYDSPTVALFISKKLLSFFMTESSNHHLTGHYVDSVLSIIFDKYFDVVWPDWSKSLADPSKMIFAYLLKYKLGHSIGGIGDGALFGVNHSDALKQWCADYPDSAPIVLATYVPVYDGEQLSDLAIFLLDNYGNNKSVLSELGCNLGSFSCVGSAVPIYEKKKRALQALVPHKNPVVNQWLLDNIRYAEADIARERDRDAEDSMLYR